MEQLIATFTEASSLQYLAAFVSLVWLLGATGVTRSDRSRGTPSGSTKQIFLWFSMALLSMSVIYLAFEAEADERVLQGFCA